jgi:TupA-like ATPgrasp
MIELFKKQIWYLLCRYILVWLSDVSFTQLTARITYSRFKKKYISMDIENPRTLNEKLNHIKIFKQQEHFSMLADKYAVRDYVRNKIGKQYLIPLLGIYSDVHQIPWESLPNQFILKTNHGSGWNIVCTDRNKLNIKLATLKLKIWINQNAFYLSREYQYKLIKPCILCEELLGQNINDYKIFCFNGQPKIIQVDMDRFSRHKRAFFDLNWELQPFTICYPSPDNLPQKPQHLDDMINISTKLSEGLKFARIDLYEVKGKIFFGEITLCPEGGKGPVTPEVYDLILGDLLPLN